MTHKWPVWCPQCHRTVLVFALHADGRESRDYCPLCGTEYVATAKVERVQHVDKPTDVVDNITEAR